MEDIISDLAVQIATQVANVCAPYVRACNHIEKLCNSEQAADMTKCQFLAEVKLILKALDDTNSPPEF
jgi:hypothetical protein